MVIAEDCRSATTRFSSPGTMRTARSSDFFSGKSQFPGTETVHGGNGNRRRVDCMHPSRRTWPDHEAGRDEGNQGITNHQDGTALSPDMTNRRDSVDGGDFSGEERLPHGAIRCGECGTIGYRSDRYCACCGTPLLPRCTRCGAAVVHPIAYYCTECGVGLDPTGRDHTSQGINDAQPPM